MKSKIESLLQAAAVQTDSSSDEMSSTASASRAFPTRNEAEKKFQLLKEKLFRVEFWNSASEFSSFAHFDENGTAQPQKSVAVGNFIRMSLPGAGKFDWVKITEIYDAPDEIILTVQPSFDPTDKGEKTNTSHFFAHTSTNNFCLQRQDKKLNFYVIGLDEKTNIDETGNLLETIRNVAASNIGYYFGIQKAQWQTFCENFLEVENQ